MRQLIIKFPEREHAERFIEWLKLYGQQNYHNFMEAFNQEYLEIDFKEFDYRNLVINTKEK